MSIGLQLCGAVVSTGDFGAVADAGITEKHFTDDEKPVFNLIWEHFLKYGKVPSRPALRVGLSQELIDVLPDGVEEPVVFYVDKVKERALGLLISGVARKASANLRDGDPSKALDDLKRGVVTAGKSRLDSGSGVDLLSLMPDQLEQYEHRHGLFGGIDGLPTPWKTLDQATLGWQNGDFSVLIGRISAGKTWVLVHLMKCAWESGTQPLLVSMEMSPKVVARRFSGMVAQVPYGDLRSGCLDEETARKFRRSIESDYEGKPPILAYGPPRVRSIEDLEVLVEQHAPTGGVWIDGINRLRAGSNSDRYARVSEAADELKFLAERFSIPIIGTTHFHRKGGKSSSKSANADLEDVGYSYAIAEQADSAFGLFQNDDLKANGAMLIRFLKTRESKLSDGMVIRFDLDNMVFKEIGVWRNEEMVLFEEASEGDSGVPF